MSNSQKNYTADEIVEILKQDYEKFPDSQTYDIYSDEVYFQDPLNKFTGVGRYQKMIEFIGTFFGNVEMEVHDISREQKIVKTEWTLNMTSPLPWQPRLSIPGWSELKLDERNLIVAHIDRWHISPFEVLLQNFFWRKKGSQ